MYIIVGTHSISTDTILTCSVLTMKPFNVNMYFLINRCTNIFWSIILRTKYFNIYFNFTNNWIAFFLVFKTSSWYNMCYATLYTQYVILYDYVWNIIIIFCVH